MGILKATEISTVKLYHGKCNVREDQVFPSAFVRVRIILASGVLGLSVKVGCVLIQPLSSSRFSASTCLSLLLLANNQFTRLRSCDDSWPDSMEATSIQRNVAVTIVRRMRAIKESTLHCHDEKETKFMRDSLC